MKRLSRAGMILGLAAAFAAAFAAAPGCGRAPRPETRPAPTASAAPGPDGGARTPPPPEARNEGKVPIPAAEKLAVFEAGADPEPGRDMAAAALEEALSAYQESKGARKNDDLDGALRALDKAYKLLLQAEVPPDSALAREKADLRLLVAQRIQEIYASRRVPIADNHKSIPLTVNKWVQREIDSFLGPERKAFAEAYRRSGFYRDWIQTELRQAGLPEELIWLAMIESWFMPKALSTARALGMWQFIASTGYRYGLTRDRYLDERMDPVKSTRAAIRYLTDLHGMFGDWSTALAAYNCGEGFVARCIAGQKTSYLDDFWDLFSRLPFQTARYVPRFIAAVLIVKEPARFGVTLPEPYPALAFEIVSVDKPAKLGAWAERMDVEAAELSFLNPELRVQATPDRPYPLRVPVGSADRARASAEALVRFDPPPETAVSTHVVRAGETLSSIALKYRTSIPAIQKLNGLKGTSLVIGQRLRVSVRA